MNSGTSLSTLVRNVLTNWGAFAFAAVVGFVLSPFVVRTLGDTGYGAWVLLNSLVGYLGLLELGVRGATTRYVARFHQLGEHGRAGELTSAALAVFVVTGLVAVGLSGLLAAFVGDVFHVPPEFVASARVVAVLGGLTIGVSLVGGVFGGVIVGLQRFDINNVVEVALGAVRAAAVLIVLKAGGGLVGLAIVHLSASVIRAIVDYRVARRLYPQMTLRLGVPEREALRMVLAFGLTSAVLHASAQLMLYSDSVIIGAFLPVGMITYFAIGASLTEYGRQVVGGVSRVITPLTSALQASGAQDALQRSLLTGARLTTALVLPIAVTFILRGSTFIGLWMGPQYAVLSGQVLALLAVVMTCHTGYQVTTATMMGMNRHRGLVPLFLGDAATNVALSIILVPIYGVVGSAIGTLVPQLIVTLVATPWYLRRVLGIPPRLYLTGTYLRPVIAMVPFALGTYIIESNWVPHDLFVFFAQVVLVLPLAAFGGWVAALDAGERRLALELVRPRRPLGVGESS